MATYEKAPRATLEMTAKVSPETAESTASDSTTRVTLAAFSAIASPSAAAEETA